MRLIDADALRKNSKMLYSIHKFEPVEGYTQDQLDAQPTIEAAPVVHAHITGTRYNLHCSNCEDSADIGNDYCPHCGAKMDAPDGSGV